MIEINSASFRDPCGFVYDDGSHIYRTVTQTYAKEWDKFQDNGFLTTLFDRGLLPFEKITEEIPIELNSCSENIAILKVRRLPFISYPYEWAFSQLKEAALLTLDMHEAALEKGFILKDASAYNIQFFEGKPVFIDHLSFEIWKEGQPWQAYGQFCQHFLAPLALMAKKDIRLGRLSQNYIDGIPLDLTSSLLPGMTKFSLGLAMHIHLHATMRQRYADTRKSAEKAKNEHITIKKMLDIAHSLRDTVNNLELSKKTTEWGEYYSDTNYSEEARIHKEKIVTEIASKYPGHMAIDLGANTGIFSRLLSPYFDIVISPDGDHSAVEIHWTKERVPNILPLLIDFSSPSAYIGFGNIERQSFTNRCNANFITVLALCHHLRFTFGIPFKQQIEWFKNLLIDQGILLIEFIPKNDSQVQRLLAARDDIFDDYNEDNFLRICEKLNLTIINQFKINESHRSIYVLKK